MFLFLILCQSLGIFQPFTFFQFYSSSIGTITSIFTSFLLVYKDYISSTRPVLGYALFEFEHLQNMMFCILYLSLICASTICQIIVVFPFLFFYTFWENWLHLNMSDTFITFYAFTILFTHLVDHNTKLVQDIINRYSLLLFKSHLHNHLYAISLTSIFFIFYLEMSHSSFSFYFCLLSCSFIQISLFFSKISYYIQCTYIYFHWLYFCFWVKHFSHYTVIFFADFFLCSILLDWIHI